MRPMDAETNIGARTNTLARNLCSYERLLTDWHCLMFRMHTGSYDRPY